MEKVNLDTIKPWISKRVTELLGTDDDVLLEFIINMLEKEQVTQLLIMIIIRRDLIEGIMG